MEEITKHYLISGRVQGVGYRAFTQREARSLNLSGWVRNLQDGRVEALAKGSLDLLSKFEARLKVGPNHGLVESLEITSSTLPLASQEFVIRKDGTQPCFEA